ncbi:hypothetical protein C1Y10_29110, partial [Pseudomonas sp. FW305-122]
LGSPAVDSLELLSFLRAAMAFSFEGLTFNGLDKLLALLGAKAPDSLVAKGEKIWELIDFKYSSSGNCFGELTSCSPTLMVLS